MSECPAGRDSCGALFLCVPVMGGMEVIGQMGEMGQIGKSYLYGTLHYVRKCCGCLCVVILHS